MNIASLLELYLHETRQISNLAKRQALYFSKMTNNNAHVETLHIVLLLSLAALAKGAPRSFLEYLLKPVTPSIISQFIENFKSNEAQNKPEWEVLATDPDCYEFIHDALTNVLTNPELYNPIIGIKTSSQTVGTPLLIVGSTPQRLLGFSRFYNAALSLETNLITLLKEKQSIANDLLISNALVEVFCTYSILSDNNSFHSRQIAAAALAVKNRLFIVSGGPGTGKTSVVIQILRVLTRAFPNIDASRIVLCAPTGKAKGRLSESVEKGITSLMQKYPNTVLQSLMRDSELKNLQSKTLHSLVGIGPSGKAFYNSKNVLPYQVIVIDEASMVDLHLFDALLCAIKPDCRILLIGDMHQLPSVEAGAVLGDLTERFSANATYPSLTKTTGEWLKSVTTHSLLSNSHDESLVFSQNNKESAGILADRAILLTHSYRSKKSIVTASLLVNSGNAKEVISLIQTCANGLDGIFLCTDKGNEPILNFIKKHFCQDVCENISRLKNIDFGAFEHSTINLSDNVAKEILDAFAAYDDCRIIALSHEGSRGRVAINSLADGYLRPKLDKGRRGSFFIGQLIMLTTNLHDLNLYNGDTGIVVCTATGELKAVFRRGEGFVVVALARLGTVEPAFSITVHKSQGSEFDSVLLVFPEYESPLLTRQIVYTGITRAKNYVCILASEELLLKAIETKDSRPGGVLRDI